MRGQKRRPERGYKMKKDKLNASGCKDLTAYKAIENIEAEERLNALLKKIFRLCDYYGFHLEGRLVLRDKRTGKIWR